MVKILVVSHDASRTGAPILLLNLGKVLGLLNSKYCITYLIKNKPHDIIEQFHEQFTTLTPYDGISDSWIPRRFTQKFHKIKYDNSIKSALKNIDIVLSNTITNGDILHLIRRNFKGLIISYIHELQIGTKNFTSSDHLASLISCTDFYLVPSLAVQRFLIENFHIEAARVYVLPYFIPSSRNQENILFPERKKTDQFIVGAAGTIDWRKSPDLFIQVAKKVLQKLPNAEIKFIWKGVSDGGIELEKIKYDILKSGLSKQVEFQKASNDMDLFYHSLDVFILTSREDPYPLVVLEAADAGVPTICFKDAGGACEFIERSNGGKIVDFLDVDAMADEIIYYYNNREEKNRDGELAKKELMKTHQNIGYINNSFETIINNLYSNVL